MPPTAIAAAPPPLSARHGANSTSLMLGALGVVYGDIGTSPLYALKECFSPASVHAVAVSQRNVLGVLSLVFYSLTMVIVVKYLTVIMRADNRGAGGILALLALVPAPLREGRTPLVALALVGTALLYGDGVITPAISVLSAIEGLEVATTTLEPVVVPLTIAVLVALFAVQRRGTGGVGAVFGPVTLVWFLAIGAVAVPHVVGRPDVLRALDPRYALSFFADNGKHGFLILGSVFLVVTGGEALYADMGHFGLLPIRRAWFTVVFPALLLSYFGQGAVLLANPAAATRPFYALVPTWGLYPMVVLATAATVVASQALISGAYSLTQQAVQLGFFPRVTIVHTSREAQGQIYVPFINGALLVGCVACVLLFRTSSALAAAYGIAVTGTMGITTVIYFSVVTRTWGVARRRALPLVLLFLSFDLAFFVANAAKFVDGGWFPVAVGATLLLVMTTWHKGRGLLWDALRATLEPLDGFLATVARSRPLRVPGTAVFMASNPRSAPPALVQNFKHNQVLHETVVVLSVENLDVPEVPLDERVTVEQLGQGFHRVALRYGFMEDPNVPAGLRGCAALGVDLDPETASYYLGRETLVVTRSRTMSGWRKRLFSFISRNARPASSYFGLPPSRVVELGAQIPL